MHIVFVTPYFVENSGPTTGLQKYLLRVSIALLELGNTVTVITCSNRTSHSSLFGIDVYRVRVPRLIKGNDQENAAYIECICRGEILNKVLHEVAEKKKIDIIQYASIFGLAYFHDLDIPAVMRLSMYTKIWPSEGNEIFRETYGRMEREAAEKCDAVFGPSTVIAKAFEKDILKHVDVIETPFVMETQAEDNSLFNELLKDKKYILFYGRLVGYKGLDVISDSIYELLNGNKDLFFTLIGDGDISYIEKILKNAGENSNRVLYHSAIGFNQLKPIIKNAQAVVLPSTVENFSNACVETMALGQIVVGTDGVSFEQLITDRVNGFLCKPSDRESFIDKVREALSLSDIERMDMKENAKRRIEKLRPEFAVNELVSYYKNVIRTYNS